MLIAIHFTINKNLHLVQSNFEANFAIMQKWFYESHMVLNPENAIIY